MTSKERDTFGARLRKLREGEGLSLEDLGEQVGMEPSYLAELEEEKVFPHVSEIITLARTLSVDPSAFLADKPLKSSPGKKQKAMAVRTKDYAYQTLTDEDPEKHLMGFRVTIDPKAQHRKVGYQHEGEEFIYVLSGKLWIKVGQKTRTLQPGESIRFDSGKKHQLKNPGSETTELIVVIFTP
ncbi:MAG: cupin domain-containing protein [bacterium]